VKAWIKNSEFLSPMPWTLRPLASRLKENTGKGAKREGMKWVVSIALRVNRTVKKEVEVYLDASRPKLGPILSQKPGRANAPDYKPE
jgi:hypothetical protein